MQKFLGRKIFVVAISLSILVSCTNISIVRADSNRTYTDPYYTNSWQWGLSAINSSEISQNGGRNITVAVIDSGIDVTHPEFAGRIVAPRNFTSYGSATDVTDETGHGTHVTGIIAAANNGTGISGIAGNVNIMPIKIFSQKSRSTISMLTNAINYAVENGADIINMSLSTSSSNNAALIKAIENAKAHGCILVAATGNEGQKSSISAPASLNGVIAVGSTNYGANGFVPSNFSNYNAELNDKIIYAPGENILSTYPSTMATDSMLGSQDEGYFQFMNGTSMATAFVSGVCALLVAEGCNDVESELLSRSVAFAGGRHILNATGNAIIETVPFNKTVVDSVTYTNLPATSEGLPVSVNFHFSDSLPEHRANSSARIGFYRVDTENYTPISNVTYSETSTGSVVVNLSTNDKIGVQDENYFMFFVENNGQFLASEPTVYCFPKSSFVEDTKPADPTPAPIAEDHNLEDIPTFSDLPAGHWASEAIYGLAALGVVHGKTDDTGVYRIEPEKQVTRAEFAKMLFNMSGAKTNTSTTEFVDVNKSDWFYPAVTWAVSNGIANGTGDGKFEPDLAITREEMAVMIFNYTEFSGKAFVSSKSAIEFNDTANFANWSRDAIETMSEFGIINGFKDGAFRPQATATRAESMMVMWKIID